MSLLKTIDQKFNELQTILENRDRTSIKIDAHGGNSILLVYPLTEELSYINRIKKEYPNAYFVDIAHLFVSYIDSIGLENMEEYFNDTGEIIKQFKSQHIDCDFEKMILNEISKAKQQSKIPVLIRTGALYGTGIDNNNIIDSEIVRQSPKPVILLYPATLSKDNKLMFLGFKRASDYRAIIIN